MRAHGITRWAKGLSGQDLVRELYLEPTANIAGFDSGYGGQGAKTVLPSQALLKMDFRLVPDQDPQHIARSLGRWMDEHGFGDIEMKVLGAEHPSRGRADHPALAALIKAGEAAGIQSSVTPNSPGTGPIYPLCDRLGISMVTGEAVARSNSLFHSPNEFILVDDYISGIKHFAAFLEVYGTS
jgi:acetylornithine deacetylase/succinyl-diaminopimelate desuccinylase-like protein